MANKSQNPRVPNDALRKVRESRGFSQRELADLLHIPDPLLVSKWESGKHTPRAENRRKLCEFFGKSPEELGFLPDKPLSPDFPVPPLQVTNAPLPSTPQANRLPPDLPVPLLQTTNAPLPSASRANLLPPDLLVPPPESYQTTKGKKTPSSFKRAILVLPIFISFCLIVATIESSSRPISSVPKAAYTTYTNPVLNAPFFDPDIIFTHGRYYAYATGTYRRYYSSITRNYIDDRLHLQVSDSPDLVHWTLPTEALPILPIWASANTTTAWAPSVIQIGHTYTLYYSAPYSRQNSAQCIGVATSTNPAGPFLDENRSPLTCQNHVTPTIPCKTLSNQFGPDLGGTVDPAAITGAGKLYLYYKNNGNSIGCPTAIWGQQLSPDGQSFAPGSRAARLITSDLPWENSIVEAPFMFLHNGQYYLFFSGNIYTLHQENNQSNEAEGYAACQGPLGPCIQAPENPILNSIPGQVIGPGSASLIQIGSQTWIVYCSWVMTINPQDITVSFRALDIDRITWTHDGPVVVPMTTRQPAPLSS